MSTHARRLATVAAMALLLVGGPAAAAEAHTRTAETTNITASITAEPDFDGVEWKVYIGGLLVEITNHGDEPLIVEGYEGEPYLRVGPEGVAHNRRSPATYLNDQRFAEVTMPPVADPTAPPEWVHVSDEPRALWHDHRTHWMSPQPPEFVDAGPLARTLVDLELVGHIGEAGADAGEFLEWEVPVHLGDREGTLEGTLAWEDAPPAWPWLGLGALLVLPALLGLRRRSEVSRVRPAALVVAGVAAINAIHLVDDLVAWPEDLLDDLFGLLHTSLFLAVGLGGAAWAWWVDSGRTLALGIASGGVLYHQGLVHAPILAASAFPTVWPEGLVRLTVALGLLQAVVVAVVIVTSRRAGNGDGEPDTVDGQEDGEAGDRAGARVGAH